MNIYRNAVAVGSVAHTHTEAVTHAVKVQVNSGNNTPPQDICAPKSCNVLSDRCLGLVSLTPNDVHSNPVSNQLAAQNPCRIITLEGLDPLKKNLKRHRTVVQGLMNGTRFHGDQEFSFFSFLGR